MAAKKSYPLRVSDDVLRAMKRWADDDLRSMNAQIEYTLREALRKSGRLRSTTENIQSDGSDHGE